MPITRDDVALLRANDPRTPPPEIPVVEIPPVDEWLAGRPMDPIGTAAEPLASLAGFPFLHESSGAVIVGPTGGGRSSLIQACLYDAAQAGLRCAYLGHEVTESEFNARAAILTRLRGDDVDDELRSNLARVRYLNLESVICKAWADPPAWVSGIDGSYELVAIDPLSAVASALDFAFDKSNDEYIRFYDQLVQPLTTRGVAVVIVDNIGHAEDAKSRAKGASAKQDRADLTFSCSPSSSPIGLTIKAQKVRSVRAGHQRGDEWVFEKDTQRINRRGADGQTTFRPTGIMERVSKAVEDGDGLTGNAIRASVGGKASYVNLALELLVGEGFVEVRKDGQAHHHHSVRPYREDDDVTNRGHRDQPCPNRVQDTVSVTVSNRDPNPVGIGHGTGHGSGGAANGNRDHNGETLHQRVAGISEMTDADAQASAWQQLKDETEPAAA
jgi:hypothetical protein